jgi:hypothetical protein
MQHKAAIELDRSPEHDLSCAQALVISQDTKLFEEFSNREIDGPVHYQPQGPLFAMLANIRQCFGKKGIRHGWHGNQKVVGEIDVLHGSEAELGSAFSFLPSDYCKSHVVFASFASILERICFPYYVFGENRMPQRSDSMPRDVKAAHPWAAFYAGIIAGVVATLAQIALWSIFEENSWLYLLNRDARLTAAILMGKQVLPPPVTFDWQIMIVATLIHLALSIAYGFAFAFLIFRLRLTQWLASGAIYGMAIYGVNMHLMTFIFPWFIEVRDWITIVVHVVFGACLARAYKKLSIKS